MYIKKYYEIVCDECGCSIGHFTGSRKEAIEEAVEYGATYKKKLKL